ncbi:hypothetical protein SAMN05421820_101659 [Pedobacter steynii]|uniref:PH domain-containing protein n=1 Tax=Pedobacter steynii TaxID=430522 RepID=A0A1G9KS11_9SPHI|nr:hypothetical protein [Pedobacter steynii]NQX38628.1 hypothetical protein [Pedobacter steynii]SDL52416.1 hypothetical protein SAMN05421820_101659 [Pedobacter steynii]
MIKTKISGSSAVGGQLFIVFSLLPFLIFFSYLILDVLTFTSLGIFALILAIASFIFLCAFSYYDVYSVGNELVFKNLLFRAKKSKSQVKEVERWLSRTSFYVSFNDGSTFYFRSSIFDGFNDADEVIKALKDKIMTKDE